MNHETSVPFRAGTEGYASFRIPAVVTCTAGQVLAFCEGRRESAADHGDIDIVLKRSADGGRTWGPLSVAVSNGQDLAGNPSPVALAGGRVLLVHVRNAAGATEDGIRRGTVDAAAGRRVFVQHSDDEGRNWSEAREITADVKEPDWRWYATTPGHALQLRGGRVVVPANHSLPPAAGEAGKDGAGDADGTEGVTNGAHSLISDDEGETWRIGYVHHHVEGAEGAEGRTGLIHANETTAAELPDGRVYFNTRHDPEPDAAARGTRAGAWSADGCGLDEPYTVHTDLEGPVVQGSLLALGDPDLLVFAGPAAADRRARMSLRTSRDGGRTWTNACTVDERPAAYSDLTLLADGYLGLLHETGETSAYETLTFHRISRTAVDIAG